MSIFTVIYIINLIIALFTIFFAIYAAYFKSQILRILPTPLRLYFIICSYCFILLNAFLTVGASLTYFITDNQDNMEMTTLRFIMVFCTQSVRNFFFTIVLERLFATVYLERYKLSYKISLFWILFIFSKLFILFMGGFFYYSNFLTNDPFVFKIFTYCVFSFHIFTIVPFTALYFLNKRLYKVTAYRITLKRRHQIFENLKVLSFILTPMLIYTIISPIGSMLTIIGFSYKLPSMPYCVFQIFYNLPHLIIFARVVFSGNREINAPVSSKVKAVKNPLGRNLPIVFPTDTYFNNLQQQWK